jgi:antitoxin VapB
MALSIKDPETDKLVRKLAKARNTSYTAAIHLAVSNELARTPVKPERDFEELWKRIQRIQKRSAARPVLDPRSDDEILGYDENGLPT